MSNICGSVDVVRERERQARLQLLDEYRDPSPQPIFSQPVKVELEDETSRRIKDTLGDFTQVQHVLENDPKYLIGISRSGTAANPAAPAAVIVPVPPTTTTTSGRHSNVDHTGSSSSSSTWSSTRNVSGSSHPSSSNHSSIRGVPGNSTKRPVPPVNGLHKPPTNNAFDAATTRRPHHPSSKLTSGGEAKKSHHNHHHHPGPSKHHRADPPTQKVHPISANYHPVPDQEKTIPRDPGHVVKEHRRTKGSLVAPVTTSSLVVPPVTLNGNTNNATKCVTPPPPPPPPPPLLQNGILPNGVVRKRFTDPNNKKTQAKFAIPRIIIPPQGDRSEPSQFEVESILKEMKQAVPPPLTAIQTPRTEERGFVFTAEIKKDISPFVKVTHRGTVASDDEAMPSILPAKKSPVAISPFNLQEDLEMSDSDDEGNMVPSCKNPELAELAPCPRSSPIDESAVRPTIVEPGVEPRSDIQVKMEVGQDHLPTHTSSSESSDTDSEDTGSESESPSEVSDTEAPVKPAPQQWGLSNFIDVARRNHSPAFVTIDTNTNSSTAVKEERPPSVSADKDGFSLADEDSVNRLLSGRYSDRDMKDYLQSPMDELFLIKNGPISIKTEVLSPIPSPVNSPVPHQPIPRGPRTPPDEPQHMKESPKRELSDHEMEELRQPKSRKQSAKSPVKSEKNYKLRTSEREDRHSRSKRKAASKQRKGSPNHPKSKSSHRKESSASKELVETSKDISSCPVPSVDVSRATHRTSQKSHHKHSSAKRDNSQTELKKKASSDTTPEISTKSKNVSKNSLEKRSGNVSSQRNSKSGSNPAKTTEDLTKESVEKPEHQSKHSHKSREQSKPGHKLKSKGSGVKRSSSKGSSKVDSKQSEADKKPIEKQKKKSKFSIKNFLQSPVQSRSEVQTDPSPNRSTPRKQSPAKHVDSPHSRDNLDCDDMNVEKRSSTLDSLKETKQRKFSTSTSRSRSRSGSRASKPKESHKKSSSSKKQGSKSSEGKRKHRDVPKSKQESATSEHSATEFSKSMFASQQSLPKLCSPIPPVKVDSAIPSVLVCIPLSKLLRIPGQLSSKLPKNQTEDVASKEIFESLSVSSCERSVTTSRNVSPTSRKDFKARHRTESAKAHTSNSSSEKVSKSLKPDCVAQRSISPLVCDKSSIECGDRLTKPPKGGDVQPKKRKSDKSSDTDHVKKKPKLSSSQSSPKSSDTSVQTKMKEKVPVVKIERLEQSDIYPPSEKKVTPKRLERRDSTSSMSSLCSQQSHKSSKANKEKAKGDNLKDGPDSKKLKVTKSSVLSTTKEIKKEKDEKPKLSVKKESSTSVKPEKSKCKFKERAVEKVAPTEKKVNMVLPIESHNPSSQMHAWEGVCKTEEIKALANHQACSADYNHQDAGSDWEHFAPDIQQELKGLPNHSKASLPGPMIYYYTEGKKLKYLASKETDPIQQALKYFEATVMFILTSLHRELSNKDPDSIYQMYKETLKFTHVIRGGIQKHQSHSMPGSTDFKILILCLKCQSLLYLKLYSLKIKEVKEQHKGVTDFMHSSATRLAPHSSPQPTANAPRSLSQPSPCQPRIGGPGSVPSPHSPTPSPAGSVASVGSQSSGYSSSEVNGNPPRPHSSLQLPHIPPHGVVTVPQNMFDVMARHHLHLSNLHMCHELWEQADMYMTRSNSKEFFKEMAEKSEKLTLHSTIKELVNYLQTGLSMLKDC